MKRVLITGVNGYIGSKLIEQMQKMSDQYKYETISLRNDEWKTKDFSDFNTIVHLAALVHKKEYKYSYDDYEKINCILTKDIANKAKIEGVKQFIFLSTMAVYGEIGEIKKRVVITRDTLPNPKTYYGKSKLCAENELLKLQSDSLVSVLKRDGVLEGGTGAKKDKESISR